MIILNIKCIFLCIIDKPIDLSNAELIWDILIADLNNG